MYQFPFCSLFAFSDVFLNVHVFGLCQGEAEEGTFGQRSKREEVYL